MLQGLKQRGFDSNQDSPSLMRKCSSVLDIGSIPYKTHPVQVLEPLLIIHWC